MSDRRRGTELGVLLLLLEVVNTGFTQIPPATLFVVAGQALLYTGYIPVQWDRWDVCISAETVLYEKEYSRLFLSAIEHGSDMHLYYNMVSFIFKGRGLEQNLFGSRNFLVFLLLMTLTCSAMYVALATLLYQFLHDYSYMKTCAIGFSGVIFALKALTAKREASLSETGPSSTLGRSMNAPMQYSIWTELVLIHLLVPGSSFVGHLAGVLAGMAYVHTPVGDIFDGIIEFVTGNPVYRWEYLLAYY